MDGDLINAVRNTLKNDVEFMVLLGWTSSSEPHFATHHLVAGMEPEKAITGTSVPMMLIYLKPGRFASNPLVFEGKFCLDFYAKTSVLAKQMAARAFKLFHDKNITDTNFHSYRCTLAFDSDFATAINGVKGFESIYDVDYFRGN